ncbi:MAG TPA: hypothetical protein VLI41_02410 [Phenylobacterium sp.]|uniref:hypothetical protein n=1 Tax=Phenylobacterium sp. TaxID=1871053 RepID=UPI002C431E6F|nr:hypothetical protein [Phenylobacterium sp.]HSV02033.1 hypothetical protein [Phenylobacterium sp.]
MAGPIKDEEREARELRAFEHGSSGATADFAVEGRPRREDAAIEAPYARPAEPLADGECPDQLAEKRALAEDDLEARIDEASEESFPASDPPSFMARPT